MRCQLALIVLGELHRLHSVDFKSSALALGRLCLTGSLRDGVLLDQVLTS